MALFRDRYRVETARLVGRDYAEAGMYFVTVCTKGQYPWFGEIRNGVMGLSDAGCVAHKYWENIPHHFPHIRLDEFVVMPNHVHGILIVKRTPDYMTRNARVETCDSHVSTTASRISTAHRIFRRAMRTACISRIRRPAPGSVGSIIGQWKTACTKHIRIMGHHDFAWQPRFYDHVIRSDRALENIRTYIRENPRTWDRDRNYVH